MHVDTIRPHTKNINKEILGQAIIDTTLRSFVPINAPKIQKTKKVNIKKVAISGAVFVLLFLLIQIVSPAQKIFAAIVR